MNRTNRTPDPRARKKPNPQQQKNVQQQQRKPSFIGLFFKIVVSMVVAFTVIASGATFAYYKVTGNVPFAETYVVDVEGSKVTFLNALLKQNIKLNVLVLGVDEDKTRTDVIFVVNFDSATQSLEVLSIPRDTRVSMSSEVKTLLNDAGRSYPSVLKINEVHAYAGQELGPEAIQMQVEDLLGIKIDHYVKVDLDAFAAIVDAVGGVDMYVPQNMYKDAREYDGTGILINLKEGQQTLDGNAAMQLVRFRDYPTGDVGRVETQQLFLYALADKVMSTETILKNATELIQVVYDYVTTDLALSDALKYVNYISDINLNNIVMEVLPGVGQYVGGVSYFLHDVEATQEVVQRFFYSTSAAAELEDSDSREYTIVVANGSNVNGLGADVTQKLNDDGYTTKDPVTHTGTALDQTMIYVKESGIGYDLVSYFSDAVVEVDKSKITSGADIHIVLGLSQEAIS
ncbi:MAG: LCP family protein [Bacillota bacterium]